MTGLRMDCARFRARHLDYLDDALPAEVRAACDRHRVGCAACAAFDVRVRRSLLLVRNTAPLPSPCDVTARVLAALPARPRSASFPTSQPLPAVRLAGR